MNKIIFSSAYLIENKSLFYLIYSYILEKAGFIRLYKAFIFAQKELFASFANKQSIIY